MFMVGKASRQCEGIVLVPLCRRHEVSCANEYLFIAVISLLSTDQRKNVPEKYVEIWVSGAS